MHDHSLFRQENGQEAGRPELSATDSLPALLRMVSLGNDSCLAMDSPEPSVHSGNVASDLEKAINCVQVDANRCSMNAMKSALSTQYQNGEKSHKKSFLSSGKSRETSASPHKNNVSFWHDNIPHAADAQTAVLTKRRWKFYSQPIQAASKLSGTMNDKRSSRARSMSMNAPHSEKYVIFRTRSRRNEKAVSHLLSRAGRQAVHEENEESNAVPAGRYFAALKGPELEILRESEELLLPVDERWPFLLRFPIGCFGICLGLGSQAILWKALATAPSMSFYHIPLTINLVLWCTALLSLVCIFTTYALKCMLYFEAVRREYYHPVRVNFFFAPWIASMFLVIGLPPHIAKSVNPAVWCVLMAPILILELKIYGQWLSGGDRRLSKVANPSTHLSLVGNFVGALLAATVGWREAAIFFWAVGFGHYLVVFVTLYQRLPTAETLPKELHPVFFLFVAAPSIASVAWKFINGSFDHISRICYFMAMFLYSSLVVRINFFRGFKFSIAWWAYTFPMAASAVASIHYSLEVTHPITQAFASILSVASAATVFSLFISTMLHGLLWDSLFPNDLAIAIKSQRPRKKYRGKKDAREGQYNDKCEPQLTKEGGAASTDPAEDPQIVLLNAASDPLPLLRALNHQPPN